MKKLTIEFIREQFEEENYVLLADEYKGAFQKLDYVCPNGHVHNISWTNFQQGQRCFHCVSERNANNLRICIEFIRQEFSKEGYKLLTTKYINSRQKLRYICPNGHTHTIKWDHWKSGSRCRKCRDFDFSVRYQKEGNPCWNGGTSCDPYCFEWSFKEFKDSIKERDGYRCLNPICSGEYNKLVIHHIDYNKKNCSPTNLITLCNSCNSRANKDRDWHEMWYKTIIQKRYGKEGA